MRKALLLILSCCAALNVYAAAFRDSTQYDGLAHHIGVNIRPSYNMPTHGFYRGWNPLDKPLRTGGSAHLQYSFSLPGSMTYQGIGLGAQTFLCTELVGTPTSLYIFQGVRLLQPTPELSVGYEWNFGLSYGWKPNGIVLSSKSNAYINVGILFNYKFNQHWTLTAGPEYTHYSNGDTSFPNGGANSLNFRIGAVRTFSKTTEVPEYIKRQAEPRKKDLTYDLTIFGSWRADRGQLDGSLELINDAFVVAGVNFNPLYHIGQHLAFGPALDLLYDSSANLRMHRSEKDGPVSYEPAPLKERCAAGISIRGEVGMPFFSVNVGLGYNVLYSGKELNCLYGMFNLKTSLTERIYLNIGYRLSSVLYSHNMMFGLGYRL